jgi:hypothetical protein
MVVDDACCLHKPQSQCSCSETHLATLSLSDLERPIQDVSMPLSAADITPVQRRSIVALKR